MGNENSKYDVRSAAEIEAWYAAQASTNNASAISQAGQESPDKDDSTTSEESTEEKNDEQQPPSASPDTEECADNPPTSPREALAIQHMTDALRDSIPKNKVLAAVGDITKALRALRRNTIDVFERALARLRELKIVDRAKIVSAWIKAHPWETAAIVVPLILLACTPAILGAVGFTAGGVAAGSVAAGIQAGIGNVAAGSLFALCTSAGMGGAGAAVVFGGVWGLGTVFFGGVALWKRWRGSGDDDVDDSQTCRHLLVEGANSDNGP